MTGHAGRGPQFNHPGLPRPGHVPHDVSGGFRHEGPTNAGGGGTGGGANSYLDSTYYGNVAQNLFNTNNRINALHLQEANGSTNLQAALARLAYQQPRDELNLEQGANRNGNLYSSVYNQNLGNLNYRYAGQQGGLISGFGQQKAGEESQIAALRGGIPLFNDREAAAAADRAAQRAAKDPSSGESVSGRLARAIARGKSGHVTRVHPGARTGHERGGGIPSGAYGVGAGGRGIEARVSGSGGKVRGGPVQRPLRYGGLPASVTSAHRGGGHRGGGIPQHYRLGL